MNLPKTTSLSLRASKLRFTPRPRKLNFIARGVAMRLCMALLTAAFTVPPPSRLRHFTFAITTKFFDQARDMWRTFWFAIYRVTRWRTNDCLQFSKLMQPEGSVTAVSCYPIGSIVVKACHEFSDPWIDNIVIFVRWRQLQKFFMLYGSREEYSVIEIFLNILN